MKLCLRWVVVSSSGAGYSCVFSHGDDALDWLAKVVELMYFFCNCCYGHGMRECDGEDNEVEGGTLCG